MELLDYCKQRRKELGLTLQEICDLSGLPIGTVKKVFSDTSKNPYVYTMGPICKVLGISLDQYFEISDHLTATEETLQAEKEGLKLGLNNKQETIEILQKTLSFRKHVIYNLVGAIAVLSIVIVILLIWCIYIDYHCADYGLWRR